MYIDYKELQNRFDKNKIVIFGCGGHARSLVNVLHEINKNIEIVLVDENAKSDETILGYCLEAVYDLKKEDSYIVAIGDNAKRMRLYNYLGNNHIGQCISIVSVSAQIGMEVKLGKGCFVASNVYIGPQVTIGDNTIINTGSIIEHESVIGNNTHIAPHVTICGRTKIGDNVFCGAGSTVIDKITICDHVIIGAGAVVNRDIQESGTYVGIPAKRIDKGMR